MRRAILAALAALAAAGLSACVTIYDSPDGEDAAMTRGDGAGAYLLVPYSALEAPDNARAFFEVVAPALSIDHPMTNAGNEELPWYCFGFPTMVDAEYARRRVSAMPGAQDLARQLLVDEACAAG